MADPITNEEDSLKWLVKWLAHLFGTFFCALMAVTTTIIGLEYLLPLETDARIPFDRIFVASGLFAGAFSAMLCSVLNFVLAFWPGILTEEDKRP